MEANFGNRWDSLKSSCKQVDRAIEYNPVDVRVESSDSLNKP